MSLMLTDDDRSLLEFENAHPQPGAAKDRAILVGLRMNLARYQQRINQLLATRDALEAFPMLVHRWERQMASYEAKREGRTFEL